jgi:N-acetylmuramoyl-L-alanine amidase
MKRNEIIIILGTPHRLREPGKQSSDGSLKECIYGRELISEMKPKLEASGFRVLVDYEPLDLPKAMQSPRHDLERQRELAMRVNFVNEVCRQQGKDRVIYVSVHVDASPPNDGQWHQANGWSVRVGTKASAKSKLLANCLYDAAEAHGLKMRRPSKDQKYWPQALYVLNRTDCPAVLTENLFQNNREDVDFLLSDEGRHAIERLHVEGIIKYIESL